MKLFSPSHPCERAICDMRRGDLVSFNTVHHHVIIASGETLDLTRLKELIQHFNTQPVLVIPGKRLSFLYPDSSFPETVAIRFTSPDELIPFLTYCVSGLDSDRPSLPSSYHNQANPSETLALKLCHYAELLPLALLWNAPASVSHTLTSITEHDIQHYPQAIGASLKQVCIAPMTLYQTQDKPCSIIAYRSQAGGHEHYALMIGSPLTQTSPLVRIHSSCYTGDLLDSIKCDCRDQLHSAIEHMSDHDGGIVVYLMQEGRGIGLINKLRTYALQANGLDTVAANEALGFEDDERQFLPAATILKDLGLSSIQLLTNNPRKSAGLESHGIKVSACIPHVMVSHEHNRDYLSTKKDRLGHTF
ncbi:MAG: GTP cyclohydrolase II RibA [Alphaproteobacteria bacterium]|nr:GTP cyclohydrolase II RibA [Alphaproteobacteria bacterium]